MQAPDWNALARRLNLDKRNSRNQPGLFVTFEGIDGAGKTTAMHSVCEELRREGKSFTLVNSLNYSFDDPILAECADWAGRIVFRSTHRESRSGARSIAMADAFRYVLAYDTVVFKCLQRGELVISDSWCCKRMIKNVLATFDSIDEPFDASGVEWIFELFRPALRSDLTFLFESDPRSAFERKQGEVTRWEIGSEIHANKRDAFVAYQTTISEALAIFAQTCGWNIIRDLAPQDSAIQVLAAIHAARAV